MPNRLARLLSLLAVVVLLAGCSQNLGPKTYNDEVRNNYMENCVKGSTARLGATGAATYCECSYGGISAPAGIPFDKFKDFEKFLRDNVGDDINTRKDLDDTNRFDDILEVLDGCAPVGPAA
ncbi:MAG TPA: hypothetical protein VM282_00480 [Acidimicrobiales bacterium]|nr:hypothetical protein [Acidimicrobiales bacterium]